MQQLKAFARLYLAALLIDLRRHSLSRQMFYIDCRVQSGYVRTYAMVFLIGVVVLVGYFVAVNR